MSTSDATNITIITTTLHSPPLCPQGVFKNRLIRLRPSLLRDMGCFTASSFFFISSATSFAS